jgi:hypothetical protein
MREIVIPGILSPSVRGKEFTFEEKVRRNKVVSRLFITIVLWLSFTKVA